MIDWNKLMMPVAEVEEDFLPKGCFPHTWGETQIARYGPLRLYYRECSECHTHQHEGLILDPINSW